MKICCVSSGSELADQTYREISAQLDFVDEVEADVILALGGDGLMIHALHQYLNSNKPIYGLNCGTVGFLMNQQNGGDLHERIANAELTSVFPLEMVATTKDGEQHKHLAFNEVSVLRYSHQSANLRLSINGTERIPKLMCDGLLLSTPMGSTAYNLSAHGPIVPLGSGVLALTPVSPFRPRRWHGALLPNSALVEIENLDPEKRPLGASADSCEVLQVASVRIREDRSKRCQILFDPGHSLEERIFREQFAH